MLNSIFYIWFNDTVDVKINHKWANVLNDSQIYQERDLKKTIWFFDQLEKFLYWGRVFSLSVSNSDSSITESYIIVCLIAVNYNLKKCTIKPVEILRSHYDSHIKNFDDSTVFLLTHGGSGTYKGPSHEPGVFDHFFLIFW